MSENFDQLLDQAQSGSTLAQLRIGLHYRDAQEFGRARRWFSRAARSGDAAASRELGKLEWLGLGMAADRFAARGHFQAAATAGDGEASYRLALLDQRANEELARQQLCRAARTGYAPALRELGVLHSMANQHPLAHEFLLAAASREDRIACRLLADRWRHGTGVEPDPEAASVWARQAARLGSYGYQDADSHADQAPPEPTELPSEFAFPEPLQEQPEVINLWPDGSVRTYPAVLSPEECAYLMETAAPWLRPSHTVHPVTGEAVRDETRTSHGCSFHPTDEDFVIWAIKTRLALCTGLDARFAEPFAMLRYHPGQEYREHFDFIDPSSGEAGREIGTRGQRQTTIFSYLTDVPEGGETHFPKRQITAPPTRGTALMFRNVLADGAIDLDSLHASLPVVKGEKWIATLWFRDKEQPF